jgi:hypothetical protein
MGMFDFLKVTVQDKKKSGPAKPALKPGAFVHVDSKSFPIALLNQKGFVVNNFDGGLIPGQTAHISVTVNEPGVQISIKTSVVVTDTSNGRMAAEFGILPVDTEKTLRAYYERRSRR